MVTAELISFIKKQKESNIPQNQYRAALLSQGWEMADIELAESQINPIGVPLPPPTVNTEGVFHVLGTRITLFQKILILPSIIWGLTFLYWYFLLDASPRFFRDYNVPQVGSGPAAFQPLTTLGWVLTSNTVEKIGQLILALSVIVFIVGVIINYLAKHKEGSAVKKLTKMNIVSVFMIIILVIELSLSIIIRI